jgi:hypothetical protein
MAAKKLLHLAIENDTRETYPFVSHCKGSDNTRYITRRDNLPSLLEFHWFISAQRRVLSNGNIVTNDRGAHEYQILKRVGEYGDGNERGSEHTC